MLTKEALHFAFQREDAEIDHIPLAEIVVINATKESELGAELNDKSLQGVEAEHTIQITTEPGGHNSGRSYYLRADSKESLETLVESVRRLAREVKKRRDNKSIFQRIQRMVRRVYESTPSRALIIFLIAMVTQATRNIRHQSHPIDHQVAFSPFDMIHVVITYSPTDQSAIYTKPHRNDSYQASARACASARHGRTHSAP